MDIGQDQNRMNAKDLTAEIDRETDALTEGFFDAGETTQRGESLNREDIPLERVQAIGRSAIFGGHETGVSVGTAGESPERGAIEAAAELSEDLNRVEHAEEFVGEETDVQKQEYAVQDQQIARAEAGEIDAFGAGVDFKKQEDVARYVATKVDTMLRKPVFELQDLMDAYRNGNRATLETLGNRKIGDRN